MMISMPYPLIQWCKENFKTILAWGNATKGKFPKASFPQMWKPRFF